MNLPVKKMFICIAALVFIGGIAFGLKSWWYVGNNIGFTPLQPIAFSHTLHAGNLEIHCAYCHIGADKSKHAVLPSMNVCMNCHQVVKTESPEIQKLTKLYKEEKPIEWIRVHDLPDHVRFTHERHIAAGIDCAACHGDVARMDRITQVKSLQMGFCLDCHRDPKVNAPINCQSCHY